MDIDVCKLQSCSYCLLSEQPFVVLVGVHRTHVNTTSLTHFQWHMLYTNKNAVE